MIGTLVGIDRRTNEIIIRIDECDVGILLTKLNKKVTIKIMEADV